MIVSSSSKHTLDPAIRGTRDSIATSSGASWKIPTTTIALLALLLDAARPRERHCRGCPCRRRLRRGGRRRGSSGGADPRLVRRSTSGHLYRPTEVSDYKYPVFNAGPRICLGRPLATEGSCWLRPEPWCARPGLCRATRASNGSVHQIRYTCRRPKGSTFPYFLSQLPSVRATQVLNLARKCRFASRRCHREPGHTRRGQHPRPAADRGR